MAEEVLLCYRTACTDAADPRGYNRVTHGLYCLGCARVIEETRFGGGPPFFPLLNLDLPAGGKWETGLVVIRV